MGIMGILRNIWNTLIGRSQKEETTEVLEFKEPKLEVVHKNKKEEYVEPENVLPVEKQEKI